MKKIIQTKMVILKFWGLWMCWKKENEKDKIKESNFPGQAGIFTPDRKKTRFGLKIAGLQNPGQKIAGLKNPGIKNHRAGPCFSLRAHLFFGPHIEFDNVDRPFVWPLKFALNLFTINSKLHHVTASIFKSIPKPSKNKVFYIERAQ